MLEFDLGVAIAMVARQTRVKMQIETTLQGPTLERSATRKPETPEAPQFSYAMSSASLERRAGASLQAHGGKPQDAETPQKAVTRETTTVGRNSGASPDQRAGAQKFEAAPAEGARDNAATRPAVDAPAASALLAKVTPTLLALAPQSAPAIQLNLAAASAPAKTSSAAIASSLSEPGASKEPLKLAAKPQAHAAAKPQETFAHLLAKRLDAKTSVFDIRLDPPELGRIAGRFEIADDGAGVLKLSFDNQATFDMFRRDEAALRQALADAGVSLDGQSLVFDYTPEQFDWRATGEMSANSAPAPDLARIYAAHIPSSLVDLFT